jgi:DNA-directed RNA polymerase specialized sigma24 family protein
MQPLDRPAEHLADLHWLAYLLTGSREPSFDIAVETAASGDPAGPYFSNWMAAWSRRVVIAKALAGIHDQLAESARRIEMKRVHKAELPPRDWSLDRGTTKSEIENALLAIDLFPRAALLLTVFEGVSAADAAVLLDASRELVAKGRTIGLQEMTANLARMQGWKLAPAKRCTLHNEILYA